MAPKSRRTWCNQSRLHRRKLRYTVGKSLWCAGSSGRCRGRASERQNERKWQQMKLASCGVLFPPVRCNEQAFGTDWGNWSPEGPGPFSSVRCVCHTHRHSFSLGTHTPTHRRTHICQNCRCVLTHTQTQTVEKHRDIVCILCDIHSNLTLY